MRDQMQEALRDSGADYADIRIERAERTNISFRGEELDHISSSRSLGGVARALVRGGWGVVTFNDISDLRAQVQEAVACARLVGREESRMAPVEAVERVVPPPPMGRDPRGVALAEKKQVIESYNEIMRTRHPKIQTTSTHYSDLHREVHFANSEGSYFEETRPDITVGLSATAREGDLVQRGIDGIGMAAGFEEAVGLEGRAEAAAQRAVELLAAPPVQGGNYTVVLNQKFGGVFAHEAFGHLSESDFVYENEKMKEILVLGRRFGPEGLNIIDDGSVPGCRGTNAFDDEGTPTRKSYLVENGVLVGRLHSRETAGKMDEGPTGNARAIAWSYPPIVRMTNTYIAPGEATFEDLIRDIDLGVYAVDYFGGQTMIEMFTFSAAYGYMIRNGKVAEMVRDVVLTGNVFETLEHMDMFGNDFEWAHAGGGCGKGGQSPLPTDLGSPHVRIQRVVVGGRS
jgi:TldD protein